jgi:hypothetical protein
MKVRHTLIAAALAVVTVPAFAADRSGADVDQTQATIANLSFGDGDNDASASDNALRGASGNIGVNIAAGVGNAQANDAAVAVADGQHVFAAAQVANTQVTAGAIATDMPISWADGEVTFNASVSDNVLRGASGNIGLNVAAGNGNAQSNAMAVSTTSSDNAAKASAESEQLTILNVALAFQDLDFDASLSGDALRNASGNIGVNIAAGLGNAQHNGMSIAVND